MLELSLQVPGVAPSDLGPGNPVLLNEILREFYTTFDKPGIAMLLPTPPPPPLPPGVENQQIREGEEVKAKQGEKHAEHLASHREEPQSEAMTVHIAVHEKLFAEEMQAQQNALIEQAATQGQENGAN
jgi:hypothetical protein